MAEVMHLSTRPGFRLTAVDLDSLRATIRAVGELDLAARQPLSDLLEQQRIAGRRVISLDLSGVTFIDCSCVGVLVAAHHRFLDLHGLLVLHGVGAPVARILSLTGLVDRLFIATAPRTFRPRAS